MRRNEIISFITNVLSEATMRDPQSIQLDQELEADLSLDSIGLASVLGKFEPLFSDQETSSELVRSLLACEKVEGLVDTIFHFLSSAEKA